MCDFISADSACGKLERRAPSLPQYATHTPVLDPSHALKGCCHGTPAFPRKRPRHLAKEVIHARKEATLLKHGVRKAPDRARDPGCASPLPTFGAHFPCLPAPFQNRALPTPAPPLCASPSPCSSLLHRPTAGQEPGNTTAPSAMPGFRPPCQPPP